MADDDETMFLCGYKRLPQYGTASGFPSTKALYNKIIIHNVAPSDTLQGLALKYNSSITEIKRLNKLWSNDSLYLRETLRIPIVATPTSELTSNGLLLGKGGAAASSNPNLLQDVQQQQSSSSGVVQTTNRSISLDHRHGGEMSSTTGKNVYDKSNEAFSDIFQRLDSSLKATARNVHRIEAQSTVDTMIDESDLERFRPQQSSSSSSRHSSLAFVADCDTTITSSNCVGFSSIAHPVVDVDLDGRHGSSNTRYKTSSKYNANSKRRTNKKQEEFVQMRDISSNNQQSSYKI